MKKNFSLLIKPVSLDCNLRCSYCFYLPRAEYLGHGMHRMTQETLQIKQMKRNLYLLKMHSKQKV